MAKRILISWLIVAIIFFLVGFGVGQISAKSGSSPPAEPTVRAEELNLATPDVPANEAWQKLERSSTND